MNILFKSILLSQCLALGLSNAFAVKTGEEGSSKDPATHRNARMSLTVPFKHANICGENTFNVVLKGSISGVKKFTVNLGDLTDDSKSQIFFHCTRESGYKTDGYVRLTDEQLRALRPRGKNLLYKFPIPGGFDLSIFQGNIQVLIEHKWDGNTYLGTPRGQEVYSIPTQLSGRKPLSSKTQSAWIMLDRSFKKADVTIWRENGVRSLRELALVRVQENILNSPDETYSQASLSKKLPDDLLQRMPAETWEKREAKGKVQNPPKEAA